MRKLLVSIVGIIVGVSRVFANPIIIQHPQTQEIPLNTEVILSGKATGENPQPVITQLKAAILQSNTSLDQVNGGLLQVNIALNQVNIALAQLESTDPNNPQLPSIRAQQNGLSTQKEELTKQRNALIKQQSDLEETLIWVTKVSLSPDYVQYKWYFYNGNLGKGALDDYLSQEYAKIHKDLNSMATPLNSFETSTSNLKISSIKDDQFGLYFVKVRDGFGNVVLSQSAELSKKTFGDESPGPNPTDEWPRKMWEIDLGQKIDSINDWLESGGDNSILLNIYLNNQTRVYWISNTGSLYLLPQEILPQDNQINIMFLSNDALIYERQDLVTGLFRNKGTIIKKTFQRSNLTEPDWDSPAGPTVQVSYEGSVITAWDFTPPTLASTDNEGGNNGGNKAMSRLSIGTSGPDISIATDGKMGGPAVLQKSNDLKNWRKLGDVPANSTELLITPRDSGNEFFRLKRVGE